MMTFMRQEKIKLRQNELKGILIDYEIREITYDMIEEQYDNQELKDIIRRYLSFEILKFLPRSLEEKQQLEKLFKDTVLSIKIRGENGEHSHDEDEFCSESQGS